MDNSVIQELMDYTGAIEMVGAATIHNSSICIPFLERRVEGKKYLRLGRTPRFFFCPFVFKNYKVVLF